MSDYLDLNRQVVEFNNANQQKTKKFKREDKVPPQQDLDSQQSSVLTETEVSRNNSTHHDQNTSNKTDGNIMIQNVPELKKNIKKSSTSNAANITDHSSAEKQILAPRKESKNVGGMNQSKDDCVSSHSEKTSVPVEMSPCSSSTFSGGQNLYTSVSNLSLPQSSTVSSPQGVIPSFIPYALRPQCSHTAASAPTTSQGTFPSFIQNTLRPQCPHSAAPAAPTSQGVLPLFISKSLRPQCPHTAAPTVSTSQGVIPSIIPSPLRPQCSHTAAPAVTTSQGVFPSFIPNALRPQCSHTAAPAVSTSQGVLPFFIPKPLRPLCSHTAAPALSSSQETFPTFIPNALRPQCSNTAAPAVSTSQGVFPSFIPNALRPQCPNTTASAVSTSHGAFPSFFSNALRPQCSHTVAPAAQGNSSVSVTSENAVAPQSSNVSPLPAHLSRPIVPSAFPHPNPAPESQVPKAHSQPIVQGLSSAHCPTGAYYLEDELQSTTGTSDGAASSTGYGPSINEGSCLDFSPQASSTSGTGGLCPAHNPVPAQGFPLPSFVPALGYLPMNLPTFLPLFMPSGDTVNLPNAYFNPNCSGDSPGLGFPYDKNHPLIKNSALHQNISEAVLEETRNASGGGSAMENNLSSSAPQASKAMFPQGNFTFRAFQTSIDTATTEGDGHDSSGKDQSAEDFSAARCEPIDLEKIRSQNSNSNKDLLRSDTDECNYSQDSDSDIPLKGSDNFDRPSTSNSTLKYRENPVYQEFVPTNDAPDSASDDESANARVFGNRRPCSPKYPRMAPSNFCSTENLPTPPMFLVTTASNVPKRAPPATEEPSSCKSRVGQASPHDLTKPKQKPLYYQIHIKEPLVTGKAIHATAVPVYAPPHLEGKIQVVQSKKDEDRSPFGPVFAIPNPLGSVQLADGRHDLVLIPAAEIFSQTSIFIQAIQNLEHRDRFDEITMQMNIAAEREYLDLVRRLEGVRSQDATQVVNDGVLLYLSGSNGLDRKRRILRYCAGITFTDVDPDEEGSEHTAILESLLDAGAHVNATNQKGETPLHKVAKEGPLSSAQVLIDGGADTNWRDKKGRTPLYIAVAAGRQVLVEELIDAGADVSARAKDYSTPLHVAAHAGNAEIVRILLIHGADRNAHDKHGLTPIAVSNNAKVDMIFNRRQEDIINPITAEEFRLYLESIPDSSSS